MMRPYTRTSALTAHERLKLSVQRITKDLDRAGQMAGRRTVNHPSPDHGIEVWRLDDLEPIPEQALLERNRRHHTNAQATCHQREPQFGIQSLDGDMEWKMCGIEMTL